jgi:putative transcriptional regulator
MRTWTRGRLLVATPVIGDPNFERTVILMIEHSDEGALGVVLNRATDVELPGRLPGWDALAAEPSVVFVGGPVQPDAVICLAAVNDPDPVEWWQPVVGDVGVVDLDHEPEDVAGALDRLRVFAGYAGWGPDQLEEELEAGAWFVVDAEPADVLAAEPDGLWQAVLRRQPGRVRLFAGFPEDPTTN